MKKIMFICHGNICRSPMAEFVMKDLVKKAGCEKDFFIVSSATSREEIGNDIHIGTQKKLRQMQIHFSSRQAVQVTKKDYAMYDYLIVMDQQNLKNLERIIGKDVQNKVHLLLSFAREERSIADPWYTGNYDRTYEDVLCGCQSLLDQLRQLK